MGRKATKLTILNNKGTSDVFFVIAGKNSEVTPSEIVDELELAYPNVREQLVRLEKAGILFLKSKKGRFRNFEINWKNFAKIVADRLKKDSWIMHCTECGIVPEEKRLTKGQAERILNQLSNDGDFVLLIRGYVVNLVKKGLNPETMDEVIESFEEEIKNYEGKFESKKNIGRLLTMWKQTIEDHDNKKHKVFVEAWERVR